MSSCPRCRHEEKSCERTAISALESTTYRDLSSMGPLKACVSGTIPYWMKIWIAFVTLIGSAIFIQGYDPYQSQGLDLALLDEVEKDPGRGRRSILSTCIYRLAKLVSAATEQNKTLASIRAWVASLFDTLDIIRLIEDPSPQLFLAACLFFAFAIAAVQHSHKADIYLNRILTMGLAVGCLIAFQTSNVVMGLKRYLTWSTIFALLFSTVFHWAVRAWKGPQTLDNGLEMGIQLHDKRCDRKNEQKDGFQMSSRH